MENNKNFPFALVYNATTAISNNVDAAYSSANSNTYSVINTGSNLDNPITFPFEDIALTPSINCSFIVYHDNNRIIQTPIDMIVNRSAIQQIANLLNHQNATGRINTVNNVVTNKNSYDGFTPVMKYLDSIIQNTDTSGAITKFYDKGKSSIANLYNDKVGDNYYAEYIYRAARKHSLLINKDNNVYKLFKENQELAIVPMFKYENVSSSLNLKAYMNIRNFRIPMKRIVTSISANGQIYNYIFVCPEYILKNYKQYVDAIKWIELESDTNIIPTSDQKIGYNYLDNTGLIWQPSSEYTKLGNTFTGITLNF